MIIGIIRNVSEENVDCISHVTVNYCSPVTSSLKISTTWSTLIRSTDLSSTLKRIGKSDSFTIFIDILTSCESCGLYLSLSGRLIKALIIGRSKLLLSLDASNLLNRWFTQLSTSEFEDTANIEGINSINGSGSRSLGKWSNRIWHMLGLRSDISRMNNAIERIAAVSSTLRLVLLPLLSFVDDKKQIFCRRESTMLVEKSWLWLELMLLQNESEKLVVGSLSYVSTSKMRDCSRHSWSVEEVEKRSTIAS